MPGKILVIEDNIDHALLLQRVLKELGYETLVAIDGREGVEMFDRHACEAVVTDLQMPQMDGYEATRRIRAMSGGRSIPIIAVTCFWDRECVARCFSAGMNGCLDKFRDAFRLDELLSGLLAAPVENPGGSAPSLA